MPNTFRPRTPVFYPSQLSLYRQCPERYFHKYVERRKVVEPFSPALVRGIAAHELLAYCLEEFRDQGTFPINLLDRIAARLPRLQYPDEAAWRGEVETVLANVRFALLDFDGSAQVMATEATLDYPYPGTNDCPPFTLRVKVDRVLRNADGGLEHGDYKTGRDLAVDAIQNVASRIVVRHNYAGLYPYVRSSTHFLAAQATRSDELTREQVQETWGEIKRTVRSVLAGRNWQPKRQVLCEWCPFYANGCSLDPAAGAGDAMAEWLDGAA